MNQRIKEILDSVEQYCKEDPQYFFSMQNPYHCVLGTYRRTAKGRTFVAELGLRYSSNFYDYVKKYPSKLGIDFNLFNNLFVHTWKVSGAKKHNNDPFYWIRRARKVLKENA